jgi:hypothetical protein
MTATALTMILGVLTLSAEVSPSSQIGVSVESDSDCPSGDAVLRELRALRPTTALPALRVAIQSDPAGLRLRMEDDPEAERWILAPADCATRAATVALVIATWSGELPAQAADHPDLKPNVRPSPVARPQPALTARIGHTEVGAGGLASVAGGLVPGGRIEVTHLRGAFGAQISLGFHGPRGILVGGGTTRFTRISGAATFHARVPVRALYIGGDVGAAAGIAVAWGNGYARNDTDASATWGLVAAARAGLPVGRFRLWTELRVLRWLYEQRLQIDDPASGSGRAVLPSWEGQWSLGMGWMF